MSVPNATEGHPLAAPTRASVEAAAAVIDGLVRTTPVLRVRGDELGVGPDVSFKLEHLQHSGTFKARGAANFINSMDIPPAGVVAASGGNHGAAVAWAARSAGHTASIFVPTISSPAKVARLHRYGADVHQVGAVYADALAASLVHQTRSGARAIHAYDDPIVMSGAGTVAKEFLSQAPSLDAMLVACGGGGLSGGMASWLAGSLPLIVCETEGTSAFAAALDAGHPVDVSISGIAADALGATRIGDNPWLALQHSQSMVVTDAETRSAQALLWEQFRIAVEPAAATPLAALCSGRIDLDDKRHVGIVLCGANVTLTL
ncbi:MAG: serine/threonine dehydratase [Acidimicrobiales bacterium]